MKEFLKGVVRLLICGLVGSAATILAYMLSIGLVLQPIWGPFWFSTQFGFLTFMALMIFAIYGSAKLGGWLWKRLS